VSATSELLSGYQHVISGLTLVTGSKGVFDVRVNGDLIFSKDQSHRYPEEGELLASLTEIVGPDVARYRS
jgi:selT/selW/selH-like putative selenoprotein